MSTRPAEPAAAQGKKYDPVFVFTLEGAVQWVPRSGEVTRYRSVGWGSSVPVAVNVNGSSLCRTGTTTCAWCPWSMAMTGKILSALSPTFVTMSKPPCQARCALQVLPPSVEVETHALLNGPI